MRLRKSFGDNVAVNDVSVSFATGEIHAILGENGAGKSTLLKILSGALAPDAGRIERDGSPVHWRSPMEARAAGVGLVPQHLSVIPQLTVLENVWMSLPRGSRRTDALRALEEHAPGLRTDQLASELSLAERQRIEIVRVLSAGADVLLLDEPTAVLSPGEAEQLRERMRMLAATGKSIVLVTHKLADLTGAHRVTVMRAGRVAAEFTPPFVTADLIEATVGERPAPPPPKPPVQPGPQLFRWRGKLRPGAPESEVVLDAGEIVALVGVDGNGQSAFIDAALGHMPHQTLERYAASEPAYIPADRHQEGLVLQWPAADNLHLADKPATFAWWTYGKRAEIAPPLMKAFGVRPLSPEVLASGFSGGNQQKLILAREIGLHSPAWMVAYNPARGLDFKATEQLYDALREARGQGVGILLIAMDLDEALEIGDRFGVFFGDRITYPPADRPDREMLARMMLGATE